MHLPNKSANMEMEALVARFKGPVFAFLLRRLRDREQAEDLTQEVFSALWKCRQVGEIANIEGYIFQIAANLLKDRARTNRRRPQLVNDEHARYAEQVDDIDPERIALGRDSCNRVIAALRALPERQRTILILSKFEHVPGKEIARKLGISISLVEKDLRRTLAYLREHLS